MKRILISMMTIAPELTGAIEAIGMLASSGAIASFGHSAADYGQAKAGIEAGITHTTHLYNAMFGMHHRNPGPIPALFEAEQVSCQVITDGVHVQAPMVRLAWQMLGARRWCLITDGIASLGFPDGEYECEHFAFIVRDGTCYYADGTLIPPGY